MHFSRMVKRKVLSHHKGLHTVVNEFAEPKSSNEVVLRYKCKPIYQLLNSHFRLTIAQAPNSEKEMVESLICM